MSGYLPALPVPNFVLFPACTVSFQFGFPALQDQLRLAQKGAGRLVVAHAVPGSKGWIPAPVGCLAEVRDIKETPHGLQATLAGISRIRLLSQVHHQGRLYWECEEIPVQRWRSKKFPELTGLPDPVKSCRSRFPAELWLDIAAFHLPNQLALLTEPDPAKRYYQLLERTREKRKSSRISLN